MSEITDTTLDEAMMDQVGEFPAQAKRRGRPPKDRSEAEAAQVAPPPFKPYTLADVIQNRAAHALASVRIPQQSMNGVFRVGPVRELQHLASLPEFDAPNGREADRPMTVFALALGPRGQGMTKKTGYQRAQELVDRARQLLAINRQHGV